LIARSNGWGDSAKTVVSSLRGKAHTILDGIAEIDSITFSELRTKLELRFSEGHSNYITYNLLIIFNNNNNNYL